MDDESEVDVSGLQFLARRDDPARFESEAAVYCHSRKLDYRYLSRFREYQSAYSGAVRHDASFIIRSGCITVGLAHVPIEERDGALSITIGGGYVPAPATDNAAIERIAMARMQESARSLGVQKIALHACHANHRWQWNRLRIYRFIDTSALDAIADLTLSEAELWRLVRKSDKPRINKYSNRNGYQVVVIDRDNPSWDLHETYRQLHAKSAGRITRPNRSFDLQYEMLLDGNATLMLMVGGQGVVGCAYFLHHGEGVDHFSTADDPDFAALKLPMTHILVWAAVRHFKARGFRYLRLAQPAAFSAVEGFGDYYDAKGISIGHFKRGTAATPMPYFRGCYYLSHAAFEGDASKFRNAMIAQTTR